MALPVLTKTWNFDVNNSIAVGGTFVGYGELMFQWKTFLTTAGSSPWTVVSSSDGVGNVGVDLWISALACNVHDNAGANHSWIVLANAALGIEFCVECIKSGGGQSTIMSSFISEAVGFTGGTATNRPTAADEIDTSATANRHQWAAGLDLTVNPGILHMQMSDDGDCTRWWIYVAGVIRMLMAIEKPKLPVSGWSPPWLCVAPVNYYAATAYTPSYSHLNDINTVTRSRAGGVVNSLYLTSEGAVSSMLGQTQTWANDLDGNAWPFFPIGLFSTLAGSRGRHGEVFDLWWGSTNPADGDAYPADLTRQFVTVGDLIVPWVGDGSTMLIA